jgi:hypothetical protein
VALLDEVDVRHGLERRHADLFAGQNLHKRLGTVVTSANMPDFAIVWPMKLI